MILNVAIWNLFWNISSALILSLYFSQRPQNVGVTTNYKIIKTPPDGHCIIHAWNIALAKSRGTSELDHKQLCELIYQEFTKSISYYRNFVPDTTDIEKELQKYLESNDYASDVGDMVLNALANATETSATIFIEDGECALVQFSHVEPYISQSKDIINLLKSGQHYDVIVFGKAGESFLVQVFILTSTLGVVVWISEQTKKETISLETITFISMWQVINKLNTLVKKMSKIMLQKLLEVLFRGHLIIL